ncbi:GPI transamidase component Gpi16 [Trichodelitschia bisporula]|uniref:GPI transamidase component Gpi16 n=1 Tax=Trichodelitschia bisporula TaxID=703511 RepID=A0A6G1HLS2_9PEZI|nr:GPI transamidase component Gpi16 [Trichodelitschia bisporula]
MFLLLILALTALCAAASEYHERLLLRPLPQNALLASFNFRSNSSQQSFDQQNFRYFPRSLGQILQHAHTKELHLRFSLGRWDAEVWGARPWHGAREGGNGVELWAWVEAESDDEANARWSTLTNALSGLFCASLNFIDSTRTIRPVMSFEPEGTHANASLQLLHGTLPHEVVCTENLTPFVKLLPCKGKAGISSLLDGHKLFDASWQAMAIDIRPVCENGECVLEIEQTVDMVLDLDRSKRPRADNPIPRPLPTEDLECDTSKPYHAEDSCYPLDKGTEPGWSLEQVFGRAIKGSCPLSTEWWGDEMMAGGKTVCINVDPERTVDVRSAKPYGEVKEGHMRCYQLPDGTDFDLELHEEVIPPIPLDQPPLHAARAITGYGQERGGVESVFTNPSLTETLEIVYLESLPWYMKPYIHTLKARLSPAAALDPIKETYYRPASDRHRGTHLELLLTIPPASTLTLSYDFEKAILRYTEYPPDPNRGFDVAAAVVRLVSGGRPEYLRTTTLLLPLPTPDFSMPYNVIILTSTVMALGFGSIFNLLVRRLVAADEVPPTPLVLALARVRGRVGAALRGLLRKGKKE